MLNRLALVTPAVLRRSLGLSTPAKRPALHHPQPRVIGMVFFRATRSDAGWKGKVLPARRFEAVRGHSQERLFRTRRSTSRF
jgi:hypothetical protein